MIGKLFLGLIVAVLISLAQQCCRAVEKGDAGRLRPDFPSDAKQLEFSGSVVLYSQNGGTTQTIRLEDLFASSLYAVRVVLENQTGEEIAITSVSSSCGCLGVYKKQQPIAPGMSTEIWLLLRTGSSAGDFGNSIKIESQNGRKWNLGVQAKVLPSFSVTPARIQVNFDDDQQSRRQLRIKRLELKSAPPKLGYSIIFLAGLLKVSDSARIPWYGVDELPFDVRLSQEALSGNNAMIERLGVKDNVTGRIVYEIPVVVLPLPRLVCHPSRVRLELILDKEKLLRGTAMLIGDHRLIGEFEGGILRLVGENRLIKAEVPIAVMSKTRSKISIQFELPLVDLPVELLSGDMSAIAVNEFGERVFEIEKVSYSQESEASK